jgi:hypothetical protein
MAPLPDSFVGARVRTVWQAMLAVIVIGCIVAGGLFIWRFIQVDRCLDSGGRWLADQGRCKRAS